MSAPDSSRPPAKRRQFQGPKGTRDFYPEDLLRRRYIEKAWRDTSIRHGFEEIEGPTFETADLYKVKSGEGILGEMFGVFSGKAEEEVRQLRETGEAPYALRPEFTPTLARMYAARAAQLPKPTKWFTAGPYFRAERPQRGRLREFYQWNVDVIGSDQFTADADTLACCIGMFETLGFTQQALAMRLSSRRVMQVVFDDLSIPDALHDRLFALLDAQSKLTAEEFAWRCGEIGIDRNHLAAIVMLISATGARGWSRALNEILGGDGSRANTPELNQFFDLLEDLKQLNLDQWWQVDFSIVRGLAYYTGMVFEAIAEGERAVCGGGRYDNLIELFGGPPTPAVGFGMGDVVLSNLLQDKGLMPEGPALLEGLSAPSASLRPDVFVISNGTDESDAQVRPLVARLRRGQESEAWLAREGRKPWDADRYAAAPLHARHSYKTTRNIGKLLEDARKAASRYAAIIENAEECTLKDLDTGESRERVKLADLATRVGRVG